MLLPLQLERHFWAKIYMLCFTVSCLYEWEGVITIKSYHGGVCEKYLWVWSLFTTSVRAWKRDGTSSAWGMVSADILHQETPLTCRPSRVAWHHRRNETSCSAVLLVGVCALEAIAGVVWAWERSLVLFIGTVTGYSPAHVSSPWLVCGIFYLMTNEVVGWLICQTKTMPSICQTMNMIPRHGEETVFRQW